MISGCEADSAPPPPPVYIAVGCSDPHVDRIQDGILKVNIGDKFGEVEAFEKVSDWIYVVRIGSRGQEAGWVMRTLLKVFIDVDIHAQENHFHPFLGTWDQCYAKLCDISGLWKDDRGQKAKIYTVTISGEGYANVLSEMPYGDCLRGTRLVKIRKVGYGIYGILWAGKFVLNSTASNTSLQWVPIHEKTHSTWQWMRF